VTINWRNYGNARRRNYSNIQTIDRPTFVIIRWRHELHTAHYTQFPSSDRMPYSFMELQLPLHKQFFPRL